MDREVNAAIDLVVEQIVQELRKELAEIERFNDYLRAEISRLKSNTVAKPSPPRPPAAERQDSP